MISIGEQMTFYIIAFWSLLFVVIARGLPIQNMLIILEKTGMAGQLFG
jgi:hypothetical protein